jgi:hypothetical protein
MAEIYWNLGLKTVVIIIIAANNKEETMFSVNLEL